MKKQYTFILSLFIAVFFTSNHLSAQIQTLIDNANSGDIIEVAEGTYNESLVIDKSITLQANGVVTLNVSGHTAGILIQENISNVSIDGFNIIGDALTGSGINVSPGANNISLTNNNIQDILLPGGGNTSPLSYGILCWGNTDPINPPTSIIIDNNTISNVLGSAISLGTNTVDVSISNNTFSNIIPVDIIGDGAVTSFHSIGVQSELSDGLDINDNIYNDLTISNNLISCTDAYLSSNTYNNSSLMLSTTFPHNIIMSDTPWWSTTFSDGVNMYEGYYNDPQDLGYNYWLSLGMFSQATSILGCMDSLACNFDALANVDDGACIYAEENFDCDGNCTLDVDCNGDCGGDAIVDNCGTCDNDASNDCTQDCVGEWGGSATLDECGICNGDNSCIGCTLPTAFNYCGTCIISDNSMCESYVSGCMDPNACNYNEDANINYDNITFEDIECINVDGICETCSLDGLSVVDNDSDDDGVCDLDEILGCMDTEACNYDINATDEDGLCFYVDGVCDTCENGVLINNDSDDDGICDLDEVSGCTDSTACNYNVISTDENNSCLYVDGICETCSGDIDGTGVIIDNDSDDDGICDLDEVIGCQDETACNYDENATDSGNCDFEDCAGICGGSTLIDDCGICGGTNDCVGCMLPTAANYCGTCTIADNTMCETYTSGCMDSTACNYNEFANIGYDNNTFEIIPCIYIVGCEICSGETDGTGTVIVTDSDGDGVCDADEIAGCTDSMYLEYNDLSTDDDGSCVTLIVYGCMDSTACNFDDSVNVSDTSCIYAVDACTDCDGNNLGGQDCNGVCGGSSVEDDCGVCEGDNSTCTGCMISTAFNYCETCTIADNDICEPYTGGCMDSAACNYNEVANVSYDPISFEDIECIYVDGICETCSGDIDGTGIIIDNDSDNDGVCDADEIIGCQDEIACNYDVNSTDAGDCIYDGDNNYNCDGTCVEGYTELTLVWSGAVEDSMLTMFTVTGEIGGELYSSSLETESGTITECWMTDLQEDCFTIDIEGPDGLEWILYTPLSDDPVLTGSNQSIFFGSECIEGCINIDACNYNSVAQVDDGSCITPGECEECCTYSDGLWFNTNAFYLANDSIDPTLYANGDNWSLSSAIFLGSTDEVNEDGTILTSSNFGANETNLSYLESNCYSGEVSIVVSFVTLSGSTDIVGDIRFEISDEEGVIFESVAGVTGFNEGVLEGTISGDIISALVSNDQDEDGVCDEDDCSPEVYNPDQDCTNIVEDLVGYNVYPNPANDRLFIEFNSSEFNGSTIQIINSLGSLIDIKMVTDQLLYQLNVSDYSSGLYQVIIFNDDRFVSHKIMIH